MSNKLVVRQEILDKVETRIKSFQTTGSISFPANYSPENALKSAWLILQETVDAQKRPVLEVCSQESIANALLNMVIQGLSPAKKQCYFIPYGNKLTMMKSYFGMVAATKRVSRVRDVFAQVVYKGDEFEFEINRGSKRVVTHKQKLENIDPANIVAAYGTVIYSDGDAEDSKTYEYTEIMSIAQIKKSWERGQTKGGSSAHRDQPDEMCKRTVLNRACKIFVNTSDDSDLLIRAFNDSAGAEDLDGDSPVEVLEQGQELLTLNDTQAPKVVQVVQSDKRSGVQVQSSLPFHPDFPGPDPEAEPDADPEPF